MYLCWRGCGHRSREHRKESGKKYLEDGTKWLVGERLLKGSACLSESLVSRFRNRVWTLGRYKTISEKEVLSPSPSLPLRLQHGLCCIFDWIITAASFQSVPRHIVSLCEFLTWTASLPVFPFMKCSFWTDAMDPSGAWRNVASLCWHLRSIRVRQLLFFYYSGKKKKHGGESLSRNIQWKHLLFY